MTEIGGHLKPPPVAKRTDLIVNFVAPVEVAHALVPGQTPGSDEIVEQLGVLKLYIIHVAIALGSGEAGKGERGPRCHL
jgi:hypothetical protein